MLNGKTGFVFGVANKRSIAWAIAQALAGARMRLALTYQGERLKENVEELAATLPGSVLYPCVVGWQCRPAPARGAPLSTAYAAQLLIFRRERMLLLQADALSKKFFESTEAPLMALDDSCATRSYAPRRILILDDLKVRPLSPHELQRPQLDTFGENLAASHCRGSSHGQPRGGNLSLTLMYLWSYVLLSLTIPAMSEGGASLGDALEGFLSEHGRCWRTSGEGLGDLGGRAAPPQRVQAVA